MPPSQPRPDSQTAPPRRPGKRVVLTCYGSFGDLHPYIALGLGLRARGHSVLIASARHFREKVEAEGLEFHPIRPEFPSMEEVPEMMRRGMDARSGSEYVIRTLMMPHLRGQYEDITEAARGADLLVAHPITYAVPLVAEKLGLPWVGTTLAPMNLVSAYDPPVPPGAYSVPAIARLAPGLNRIIFGAVKRRLRVWGAPAERLRAELGLPRGRHPVFEGQFSSRLNLALFSELLGRPQPDWPAHTRTTGFLFYDRQLPGVGLPAQVAEFLDAGPPPVVFTLGSAAVLIGGDFYLHCAEAARLLGRRAVLLVGKEGWNQVPNPLPAGVIACDYAPHSELFPRAAAIVHQGGVGTTGQGLRSGRPTLIVPFAHDQPDNAWRVRGLGVSRTLPRHRYTAQRAAAELRHLLDDSTYATRAGEVARQIRAEEGVRAACDALEEMLWRRSRTVPLARATPRRA